MVMPKMDKLIQMKIIGLVGFVTSIATFVLFVESYYAHASDINEIKIEQKSTRSSFEITLIEMRIDILEDRLSRAKYIKNKDKVDYLERSLSKQENRRNILENYQKQIDLQRTQSFNPFIK